MWTGFNTLMFRLVKGFNNIAIKFEVIILKKCFFFTSLTLSFIAASLLIILRWEIIAPFKTILYLWKKFF